MTTAEQFAFEAECLPDKHIPYASNGDSLAGMDCQGLMEHCLRRIGIIHNWRGSNAMYRDMAWVGTPEACVKRFGKIPAGAWLFIWADDGGEISRGYRDGLGNANHVGVYTGKGAGAVHASASRGKVCESKFAGKTIPNGGWNRVGLCRLLDYGEDVTAALREKDQPEEVQSVVPEIMPTVRLGSRGDAVVRLQTILHAIGYDLKPDGIFGRMTLEAVKTYQATHALEPDGIVGPMTWAELM